MRPIDPIDADRLRAGWADSRCTWPTRSPVSRAGNAFATPRSARRCCSSRTTRSTSTARIGQPARSSCTESRARRRRSGRAAGAAHGAAALGASIRCRGVDDRRRDRARRPLEQTLARMFDSRGVRSRARAQRHSRLLGGTCRPRRLSRRSSANYADQHVKRTRGQAAAARHHPGVPQRRGRVGGLPGRGRLRTARGTRHRRLGRLVRPVEGRAAPARRGARAPRAGRRGRARASISAPSSITTRRTSSCPATPCRVDDDRRAARQDGDRRLHRPALAHHRPQGRRLLDGAGRAALGPLAAISRTYGVSFLLYGLLDVVVDGYFDDRPGVRRLLRRGQRGDLLGASRSIRRSNATGSRCASRWSASIASSCRCGRR